MRDENIDPPEMAKVRKLRKFPFLTNEEILQFGGKNNNEIEDDDVLRGSVDVRGANFDLINQNDYTDSMGASVNQPTSLTHS